QNTCRSRSANERYTHPNTRSRCDVLYHGRLGRLAGSSPHVSVRDSMNESTPRASPEAVRVHFAYPLAPSLFQPLAPLLPNHTNGTRHETRIRETIDGRRSVLVQPSFKRSK